MKGTLNLSTDTPPVPDPAHDALVRAHAQLMQHSELQFDFPKFVPPQPPEWLLWLSKHLGWLRWVGPYIGYVMWAIVIAALAMVLFLIIRSLIRRGFFSLWRTKGEKPAEPEWRPTPETALLLLSDADKLAAEGRYADAIHLILLRSIEDISRHRPTALKPALTSREIGQLEALPLAAREAFVHIAAVAEHAIFAGREVGRREYAECRAAYERFAFPDVWSMKRAA